MDERVTVAPSRWTRRAGLLLAWAVLLAGCAWHRIEGPRDLPAVSRIGNTVAIAAADGDTSLDDLKAVARLWTEWGAFERVLFTSRDGDPVDLVVEVRLRQRVDPHSGANVLKAVATGLTLGLPSPWVGARLTEIHDVEVRCVRGEATLGPFEHEVQTSFSLGVHADVAAVAREADAEQMRRLARAVLESVAGPCSGTAGARR